jgi:hypothetical protein
MSTLRQVHKKNYTVIQNSLAQNNKLSLKAKGLMLYLLSLPDDWEVKVKHLVKVLSEGRDSILNTIKELRNEKYIHYLKLNFSKWSYFVSEEPIEEEELKKCLRTNGFSVSSNKRVFPSIGKSVPLLSNKENIKNIESNKYCSITKNEETEEPIDPKNECSQTEGKPSASSNKIYFSKEEDKFRNITKQDWDEWKYIYTLIDFDKEIIKAKVWLKCNPSKAKKKNWRRFLNNWFNTANEKAERQAIYKETNSKKTMQVATSEDSSHEELKKISPIYERYKAWTERITDPYYLNLGFLVLTSTCFYHKKKPNLKYNLNYEKFVEVLRDSYKVPEQILRG